MTLSVKRYTKTRAGQFSVPILLIEVKFLRQAKLDLFAQAAGFAMHGVANNWEEGQQHQPVGCFLMGAGRVQTRATFAAGGVH